METDEEEDYDFDPEATAIFKPIAIRRMICKPVGDWIDCKNTDCEVCDYERCDIKKKIAEKKEKNDGA